jgi:hypothetical protein
LLRCRPQVSCHLLRHACGFAFAAEGFRVQQVDLDHKTLRHATHNERTSPAWFT